MNANNYGVDPESAVRMACADKGLNFTNVRQLHHYSNAVFLLPIEKAVARLTVGTQALARIRRTQAITRWLVDEHHFPATRPLPETDPVAVNAVTVVSFWIYYAPPADTLPPNSAQLATLLRLLHQVGPPPLPLPDWIPLISLHDTIEDHRLSPSLTDNERDWIQTRISEVRDTLARLSWPLGHGLIHGDAWAGNLLPHTDSSPAGVVLGDWDWVSIGPREVDLIPTWHAATRYGKGPSWVQAFINRYGYDLTAWDGYPTLMAMRDLVQLTGPIRRATDAAKYHSALRQRLDDLRSGDTASVWTAI
jgi:hypothetical protein